MRFTLGEVRFALGILEDLGFVEFPYLLLGVLGLRGSGGPVGVFASTPRDSTAQEGANS